MDEGNVLSSKALTHRYINGWYVPVFKLVCHPQRNTNQEQCRAQSQTAAPVQSQTSGLMPVQKFFFLFLQFHRRHDCKCAKKSFHFNTTNAIRAVEYQPSLLTTCSPFLPSCVNKATGSELLFYLQKCENIKYCICIGQEKQVIIVYRYQLKKKICNRMLEMGCKALRWPLFKNRII